MRKIIFISFICLALLGLGIYLYLQKGHRNIETEKAEFVLSAEKLASDFQNDLTQANQTYLNQTIEITGNLKEISDSTLSLDPGIFCTFSKPIEVKPTTTEIKVKCRCIGYDELFGEVKLDQCSLIP